MQILIDFGVVFLNIFIILITADFVVKSSVKLAKHFHLSDEFIGMTILAIGTSIPEILNNIVGGIEILKNPTLMNKVSGLVIGSTIGSDIFQQNFLIGVIALFGAILVARKHLIKDVGGLIGATALVFIFALNGVLSRWEGAILFFGYIAYIIYLKRHGLIEKQEEIIEKNKEKDRVWLNIMNLIYGIVIMSISAHFLLNYSIKLIDLLPISASFFGVLLLGVASAFPELVTSLIALFKGKSGMSAGILIGSNITNPMLALGLGSMISTFAVPQTLVLFDLPFKILSGLLLLIFLWNKKLSKIQAVTLITLYILFLVLRGWLFPVDILM